MKPEDARSASRRFSVGDRVRFIEEVRPYTVQAVSADGRWVVCTKPFAARRTVTYSLMDTVNWLRGVDDSIGNSLGYETREECEHAIEEIARGAFGFSRRKPPIPVVFTGDSEL